MRWSSSHFKALQGIERPAEESAVGPVRPHRRPLADNRLPIGSRNANISADASRAIHLHRLTDVLQVKFPALRGIKGARLGAVPPHQPAPALHVPPAL
jgi:hypothetical protein